MLGILPVEITRAALGVAGAALAAGVIRHALVKRSRASFPALLLLLAVARGVDHHFGQDRLAARLALEHSAADRVAVQNGIHAPAVQERLDLGLGHHLDHHILQGFGVDRGIHARPPIDDPAIQLVQPLQHLLADALADLFAAGHDVPDDNQHQAAGPQTAQMPVTFHQRHVRPGPLCRQGRRHASGAAADHQHVRLMQHRQLTLRLHDPAVDQLRTGAGRQFCLGSDDAALEARGCRRRHQASQPSRRATHS